MTKPKLIGSFGSIEQAEKQISKYFYSTITLDQSASMVWQIHNSNGLIRGFQLIKQRGRYRFVLINQGED
jgi:hypothetical protein